MCIASFVRLLDSYCTVLSSLVNKYDHQALSLDDPPTMKLLWHMSLSVKWRKQSYSNCLCICVSQVIYRVPHSIN